MPQRLTRFMHDFYVQLVVEYLEVQILLPRYSRDLEGPQVVSPVGLNNKISKFPNFYCRFDLINTKYQ